MKQTEPYTYQGVKTVKIVCDICGREAAKGEWRNNSGIPGVNANGYATAETHVSVSYGEVYPENRYGQEFSVDICPGCFVDRLIPWLKTQGVTRDWEEWDA